MQKKIDRNIFVKTKSKTTQEVYEKCKERLFEKNVSENELAAALRNAYTSAMIIPGSSLKGAIRTAIINYWDNGELKQADKQKLEQWFGKTTENAFKQLKVSDFELLPDESEFVQAVQYAKNDPAKRLMNPICEVAPVTAKPKYGNLF